MPPYFVSIRFPSGVPIQPAFHPVFYFFVHIAPHFGRKLKKLPGCTEQLRPEFFSNATDFRVVLKNVNYNLVPCPHQVTHQDNHQVTIPEQILSFCTLPRSKKEIAEFCGYRDLRNFILHYINPLLETGQLVMTIPEKPKCCGFSSINPQHFLSSNIPIPESHSSPPASSLKLHCSLFPISTHSCSTFIPVSSILTNSSVCSRKNGSFIILPRVFLSCSVNFRPHWKY